jgi:hypothetical protein
MIYDQSVLKKYWNLAHSWVEEKTSEPRFGRVSVGFVRVFIGRSHPLSFWLQYDIFGKEIIFTPLGLKIVNAPLMSLEMFH